MSSAKSFHSFTSNAYGRDNSLAGASNSTKAQGSFGCVSASTGAFSFASPLGFITCWQSHTDFSDSRKSDDLFAKWTKEEAFFSRRRAFLNSPDLRSSFLADNSRRNSQTVGFKVRRYRSGEMTGAQFSTGSQVNPSPVVRSGPVETTELTSPAKTKIRRAVECADTALRYFCTLTFAPTLLHPWQQNDEGSVRHDFAKWKLRNFLAACRNKQSRLKRELNYLWVAEIQGEHTNNIHFHIMWDQFFDIKWLTKIWAQANNSVDIKRLNNSDHAANYMRKYLTKGKDQTVQGNRYFIAHKLREDMIPRERMVVSMSRQDNEETGGKKLKEMRETLQALKDDIESGGGHVLDFGFHISRPRSARKYKDKDSGEERETVAVDPRLCKLVLNLLMAEQRLVNLPF